MEQACRTHEQLAKCYSVMHHFSVFMDSVDRCFSATLKTFNINADDEVDKLTSLCFTLANFDAKFQEYIAFVNQGDTWLHLLAGKVIPTWIKFVAVRNAAIPELKKEVLARQPEEKQVDGFYVMPDEDESVTNDRALQKQVVGYVTLLNTRKVHVEQALAAYFAIHKQGIDITKQHNAGKHSDNVGTNMTTSLQTVILNLQFTMDVQNFYSTFSKITDTVEPLMKAITDACYAFSIPIRIDIGDFVNQKTPSVSCSNSSSDE